MLTVLTLLRACDEVYYCSLHHAKGPNCLATPASHSTYTRAPRQCHAPMCMLISWRQPGQRLAHPPAWPVPVSNHMKGPSCQRSRAGLGASWSRPLTQPEPPGCAAAATWCCTCHTQDTGVQHQRYNKLTLSEIECWDSKAAASLPAIAS
jgi:hypothetical protein